MDDRKMPKLTAKQEAFARAVAIKRMNYSDAYRSAFNTKTKKVETVWTTAYQIKSYPQVAARIAELQEKATNRLLMSRQQWLEKLESMAQADVRKLFNPQGDLKPVDEISDAEADLIEGLEVVENFTKVGDHAEHTGYTKKVKLTSKRHILKDYGEARGWLEQKDEGGPRRLVLRKYEKVEVHFHENSPNHTGSVIDITGNGHSGNGHGTLSPSHGGPDPSSAGE